MVAYSGPYLSSGHTGCNRSINLFRECFYSPLTGAELRACMQSIRDYCGGLCSP